MKISRFIFLSFLSVSLVLLGGCGLNIEQQEQKGMAVSSNDGPIDLIQTREETAEWTRWRDKSFVDLMDDANSGDRGALYMIGMCNLLGCQGIPINVEMANLYFALSASLGFAPAIDKIRAMYMEDCPNPWLVLVYVNLVIASGHTEFITAYHGVRKQMVEQCGREFVQEIERIALDKYETILSNQIALEKAEDKKKFIRGLYKITFEDAQFDTKYWTRFLHK